MTNIIFIMLISICVAMAILSSTLEHSIRKSSTSIANRLPLIIAADGSKTDALLLSAFHYSNGTAPALIPLQYSYDLLSDKDVDIVAPLAFGDMYAGHMIVGSTADFVSYINCSGSEKHIKRCVHNDVSLLEGRLFNNVFEAVIGSNVPLDIGSEFSPSHGLVDHDFDEEVDGEEIHEGVHSDITIVGRMQKTGSSWDNAILVPVENVWLQHGLAFGKSPKNYTYDVAVAEASPDKQLITLGNNFEKEFTPSVPFIVFIDENQGVLLQKRQNINAIEGVMAFGPGDALTPIYKVTNNVQKLVTLLTVITQILIIIAILVAISALIRLFERAITTLRAIGASKKYIAASLCFYVGIIIFSGTVLGVLMGVSLTFMANNYLENLLNMPLKFRLSWAEIISILLFLFISILSSIVIIVIEVRKPVIKAIQKSLS